MSHYFINDDKIKHNKKIININYNDRMLNFYTDNGVFSKEHFDYGSRLLVNSFLKEEKSGFVLDLGCGYGVIGTILSFNKNFTIDMVDINTNAVKLANENLKLNNVSNAQAFVSDIYSSLTNKYDYIITNPPIRAGKDIIRKFLFDGKNYLKDNGEIWFVMRKDHGVKSMIKELESDYLVNVIDKDKGFYVVMMKKNKNFC